MRNLDVINSRLPDSMTENRKIADIIWKNPLLSGLYKLKKKQLIRVIEYLIDTLDCNINVVPDYDDCREQKDIIWDEKIILCRVLYRDYFKE